MSERPTEQLQPVPNPPPWPIVPECWGHPKKRQACAQCAGGHDHQWRVWRTPDPAVLGHSTGPDNLPVRCTVCGARKCDRPACMLRRHHRGNHEDF